MIQIREAVAATLIELGIQSEQITDEARLQSDLELDSTETVQIALEMKRRFSVDVKIDASQDPTVADVIDLVEGALKDATPA